MALNADLEVPMLTFGPTTTAVTSANTTVLSVVTHGRNLLSMNVENTGSNAVTACIISKKMSANDDWHAYFGDTDFESATNDNIEFIESTTPHDLAAAGTSAFQVWVSGAYAIKVEFASTSGTTVVTDGNLSRG